MTALGRRLVTALTIAAALSMVAAPPGSGLVCMFHQDPVGAAEEALAGDHPLWGDAYIIGRVDEIVQHRFDHLRLTVTPTHVFSGQFPEQIRLAARSDGPPDPRTWAVGVHYFLTLSEDADLDGVHAFVSPCAPNFRIVGADQVDRLVRGAPTVDVRVANLPLSEPAAATPAIAIIGVGVTAIGIASFLAFRRETGRRA